MAADEEASRAIDRVFAERVLTKRMTDREAPRSVPGLMNAHAEDGSGDLNWWQAANVRSICDFLESEEKESDGLVLCDAPGLGKTLSVLAAIVRSEEKADDDEKGDIAILTRCRAMLLTFGGASRPLPGKLVIVFAGKGIVAQWAAQIMHHFEPDESGLQVFCADSERAKYKGASLLSTRAAGERGGVYVDERPTGKLPDNDLLQTFSVLVLAKEMLSQGETVVCVQGDRTHAVGRLLLACACGSNKAAPSLLTSCRRSLRMGSTHRSATSTWCCGSRSIRA
jgi:hypothetical protein